MNIDLSGIDLRTKIGREYEVLLHIRLNGGFPPYWAKSGRRALAVDSLLRHSVIMYAPHRSTPDFWDAFIEVRPK